MKPAISWASPSQANGEEGMILLVFVYLFFPVCKDNYITTTGTTLLKLGRSIC